MNLTIHMSYDGKAQVSRPIADDISVGHVILRQPAPTASNPPVESLAAHCEVFFSDWSQKHDIIDRRLGCGYRPVEQSFHLQASVSAADACTGGREWVSH